MDFKETHALLLAEEKNYLDSLEYQYYVAQKNIEKEMKDIIIKYGEKGKLSRTEMYKYNRMQRMNKQLGNLSGVEITLDSPAGMQKYFEEQLGDGMLMAVFETEKELGVNLSVQGLNASKAMDLYYTPVTELYTTKVYTERAVKIKQAFLQSVIQGETFNQASKRMQKVLEGSLNQSKRIIQTESTAIASHSVMTGLKQAEKAGVPVLKEWIATGDSHTRESHLAVDGEQVPLDSVFSNGLTEPGDPTAPANERINCRCKLGGGVEGYNSGLMYRRARIDDGKTMPVLLDDFEKWKQNKLSKIPKPKKKPKPKVTGNPVYKKKTKDVVRAPKKAQKKLQGDLPKFESFKNHVRHTDKEYVSWFKDAEDMFEGSWQSATAFGNYTGSLYDDINTVLRHNMMKTPDLVEDHVRKAIEKMDSTFAKKAVKLPEDTIMHRGTGFTMFKNAGILDEDLYRTLRRSRVEYLDDDDVKQALSAFEKAKGGIITEDGYMSMSYGSAPPPDFQGKGVSLRIATPKNSDVIPLESISAFQDEEREILAPRGSKMKILNAEYGYLKNHKGEDIGYKQFIIDVLFLD